jgi:NTE family protein
MKLKKDQPLRLLSGPCLLFFLLLASGCVTRPPDIDIPTVEPTYKQPKKSVGVALVLGAGGSRAIAHLGVLEVLEEEGVPIDLIVGCSGGSIVGALYADQPNIKAIKRKLIHLKAEDILDPSIVALPTGLVQGNTLQSFLVKHLRAKNFDDLEIPMVAVATNVDNNHIVLLRSGPIVPAIHASSALPPVFLPVTLYNQTLVDGGVIAPVPVQVARLYKPKLLIAVDISTPPPRFELSNGFDILSRSLHIAFYELSRMQSSKADILLHPDLAGYGTFDDKNNLALYEKGKATTRAAINNIKRALARRGIKLKSRLLPLKQAPLLQAVDLATKKNKRLLMQRGND